MTRKHTSRRGYWIIIGLIAVITLAGMEGMHWSFLRTEGVCIAGVLICTVLTGIKKYRR